MPDRSPCTTGLRLPVPRRSRRGTTILSVIFAMGLIGLCLTMVLRAYVQGRRYEATRQLRVVALGACQQQIELMRSRGYARLPAIGHMGFSVPGQETMKGELQIAAGPVSGSKQVTAQVTWPAAADMPAGRVELATILTSRGLSP